MQPTANANQVSQEILLDCDQSNVLLAHIIFFFVPFSLY